VCVSGVQNPAAGIPCPVPVLLRLHVLVMGFIGESGWGAPRLKDVELSDSKWGECYRQLAGHMRTLFQKCRLVHADLSEYNLLT